LARSSFTCAPSASRGRDGERAFHLLLDALNGAGADAALARDLAHAFPATQLRLDALFQRGINFRSAERFALGKRALGPAWMRCWIMLRSNSAKAPQT
jgi:hypothetical protein